jgi:DNA-binding GntR family transcriptional regulator
MNAAEGPGRALIDQTISHLEHLIFRGELKPGDKLSEQALSSRFGISREPLREAIRSLERRRLVERVPFAGLRVVQLTVDDIEQLLVTREAREGMACRQAAENMTLHERRQLCQSLAELERKFREEGPSGVFRNGAADNDLHIQIARGSPNRWLILFAAELYPLLRICWFQSMIVTASQKHRGKEVNREHRAIIEAIEQRDPDAAERLMRAHLVASCGIARKSHEVAAPAGRYFADFSPVYGGMTVTTIGGLFSDHPVMRTSLQVFVLNDAITFFCN